MSELLEHILNGNYASANDLFEERMINLQEQKLYEAKRIVAADLNEVFGMKFSKAEIEAKRAAGYRKATDVLGDPSKKKMKPLVKLKKKKKVSEEALDEAGLAPQTRRAKLYRFGLKAIRDVEREKAAAAGSESERQAADLRKSHGVERPEDKKRPGVIRRNVNTLMGRKPGYVKPETPDDEKGGRAGKALRGAGKVAGFAGRVVGSMLTYAEE